MRLIRGSTVATNAQITPADALEYAYPVSVLRCAVWSGSGGDGFWRGGDASAAKSRRWRTSR